MAWMAETSERRMDPRALMPGAKSLVMLGLNYGPAGDPLDALERRGCGAISVYARHRDYHDVVKGKLKALAAFLVAAARPEPVEVKVFVDTAPLMEKPLAQRAGIGWQGKHTNLVSREFGSWLFLGAILTDLALAPDVAETDHCGTCSACLDVVSDKGVSRAVPARRAALHFLPDDRAERADPARIARSDRQSDLRLRRLSRRLSVEQVRPRGA